MAQFQFVTVRELLNNTLGDLLNGGRMTFSTRENALWWATQIRGEDKDDVLVIEL